MMDLVLYPYADIQGLLWANYVVKGDRSNPDKPFRWDKISLNLPGDPSYSPTINWMSKVRGETQELAADFTTFVDESRVAEGSEKEAWSSARRVGSICQYLGLKYAPRKRMMDGQDRGPWIETKVHIIYGSIYQMIGKGNGQRLGSYKKWLQRVASG